MLVPKLRGSCLGRVNWKNVTREGLPSRSNAFSIRFKKAPSWLKLWTYYKRALMLGWV